MRHFMLILVSLSLCGCCLWRSHHVSEDELLSYQQQVEEEITRLRNQNDDLLSENNRLRESLANRDAQLRPPQEGNE